MLNVIFTGWARIAAGSKRHYFSAGRSLCGAWKMFADSEQLDKGKPCPVCLKKRVEMRKAA